MDIIDVEASVDTHVPRSIPWQGHYTFSFHGDEWPVCWQRLSPPACSA